nr:MAG TPA: hypothetical protein [Caudoviricetes sp.]
MVISVSPDTRYSRLTMRLPIPPRHTLDSVTQTTNSDL